MTPPCDHVFSHISPKEEPGRMGLTPCRLTNPVRGTHLRALRGHHLHRTHRQRRLFRRQRADCRMKRIAVVQFRIAGDADDFDLVAHMCLQTATDEIERRTVLEGEVLYGTSLPRRPGRSRVVNSPADGVCHTVLTAFT